MLLSDATHAVRTLWESESGHVSSVSLQPCPVSGNNRVFFADAPGRQRVVAKFYFPSKPGETDRLDAEWGFLKYASSICPDAVPQLLACDPAARLALYEYIDGVKLTADQIGPAQVAAAADFIVKINRKGGSDALPEARESCFSLAEHFAVIEERLARLNRIPAEDARAVTLADEMKAFWRQRRRQILEGAKALGIDLERRISGDERVLSPSDFGFHNAIARSDGRLIFIDFEYAGWDDVAKLAADFFYHPAVRVSRKFEEVFLAPILSSMADPAVVRRRIALFRPIYGLKWCGIMLNCFLPDMAERARFADPAHDAEQRKLEQYTKARSAFDNLVKEKWPT